MSGYAPDTSTGGGGGGAVNLTQVGGAAISLGQKTMANSLPVVLASDESTLPISAASLPLPAGAATAALQTQPGVDIGDVTVNNAAGAAAVNVQDGGNSLTVDGSVTVSGTITTKTALTAASPANASVGVASAQVVASNGSRKGLLFVNVSNNRISFGVAASAVLDSGVTLYPGGTWEMDEYCFATGAVNAIASAASSSLAIQEFS